MNFFLEESMIKYFREKIIGRPGVFSRAGDLPIDDTIPSIEKTNSQNSLTDIISTSTTSNDPTTQYSFEVLVRYNEKRKLP
jgi:hypothetical protein